MKSLPALPVTVVAGHPLESRSSPPTTRSSSPSPVSKDNCMAAGLESSTTLSRKGELRTSTRSRFEYVSGALLNVVTAIDDDVTVQDSPVPSKTFWESLSSSRSVVPVPPLIVRLTEGHEVAQEPELGVVTGVLEIVSLPPFPSIKSSWRLSV